MKPVMPIPFLLAAALASWALPPASGAATPLPDSGPGRTAAAYLEAFNLGEEPMRAFFGAHVAAEAMKRRSLEERLGTYRQMREEHGKLTLERVISSADDRVRVLIGTERGEKLDLTFECEAKPPHGLVGIRVEVGGPPEPAQRAPVERMSESTAVAAWRTYLDSLARAGAFSGAVLLSRGDSILFRNAYGEASRERRMPNRLDTRFNLGSINKIFTKLAIGQLVEQGKVGLDHTIDHYLPDYPREVASRVTVRQLLEHRGGIADFFGEAYRRTDRSKLRTVADWIPLIRDQPLRFEPGTQKEYSNGGYVLLGAIVEKASGESYYDYIRRYIYGPLGMSRTDHFAMDGKTSDLATGYTREHDPGAAEGAGLTDNAFSRPMRGSPAGGGYSTLDDLLRFTRALRASKLLGSETVRNGFAELGGDESGEARLGIGGGAPGINAAVELAGPYTIIVLANLDPPAAENSASWLRRRLPTAGSAREVPAAEPPGMGGRRMRRAHEGGTLGGQRPSESPQRSLVPQGGADVEMLRNRHLPVVEVRVNGEGPYRFAIDTGAAGLARIDSALAAKLGLEPVGQVRAGDPSGRNSRLIDLVPIGSIEIGGARFEGLTAGVSSNLMLGRGGGVDGVLGFGLFKECLMTLDYPGNRVRLERGELPEKADDVLDYVDRNGVPSVRLRVDTLWMEADVDAGAPGGFSLPASLAERLVLAAKPRVVGRARTAGKEFEIQAAELVGAVRLGGHEFPKATVEFQPVFPMANVGARVLQGFRVTFDQKNRRMRLARAG